ncbi:hypothetical protein MOE46_19345 [Bacillus atrophaeus]|uniref:hypothetical protein n=1 Tax=Bacillus atrophaeus TaxID=1452 RepID=UPI00227F69EA|nr:hypothetical protein [Bacillus atrophaeus]MCY9109401.1 hypothetical protein [Bacillus atrophaeus]
MTNTTKNKSKKGFYNFLTFEDECQKCHFVSNIGVNHKIRVWQSVIQDGNNLYDEDLYNEIKGHLRKEFEDIDEITFNKSVQNTGRRQNYLFFI